jgi:uncharacterized protein YmfQ (DUF2313 family)
MEVVVNVVQPIRAVQPKHLVQKIGKGQHRLHLQFDPLATPEHRWKWIVTIIMKREITGSCATPEQCTAEAKQYVALYE